MSTITCTKCKLEKLVELFPKVGKQCKVCVAERDRAYVEKNRAQVQARKNIWQQQKRAKDRIEQAVTLTALQQARNNGDNLYFTGTPCKQGHVAYRLVSNRRCLECSKISQVKYREDNRDTLLESKRAYAKKQRKERPQHVYAIAKKSTEKHRETRNKEKAEWRKKNSGRVLAWCRERQLAKKQRTPAWLTEYDKLRIECIYSIAMMLTRINGEPWHVDHILPLHGETVSGLHVPDNLQVLRGVENLRKGNRLIRHD